MRVSNTSFGVQTEKVTETPVLERQVIRETIIREIVVTPPQETAAPAVTPISLTEAERQTAAVAGALILFVIALFMALLASQTLSHGSQSSYYQSYQAGSQPIYYYKGYLRMP
jgi:hypothetical protein